MCMDECWTECGTECVAECGTEWRTECGAECGTECGAECGTECGIECGRWFVRSTDVYKRTHNIHVHERTYNGGYVHESN